MGWQLARFRQSSEVVVLLAWKKHPFDPALFMHNDAF